FIKVMLHDPSAEIACIGPAGENLVPYASVVSGRRSASRGGMGAVMGSKNLKAVVVKGTQTVPVADSAALREALRVAVKETSESHMFHDLREYGTAGTAGMFNEVGIVPAFNFREASRPEVRSMVGESARPFIRKAYACGEPCMVHCSKITAVSEGLYKGVTQDGPEYDSWASFGPITGTFELAPVIYADLLADQYGLDSISTGVTIAFAMECYERGLLTKADTDGMELTWGNHALFERLIRAIAYREGFGGLLALGTKGMSEKIGQGSERFAMQCKGMELGSYDPRAAKGTALVFAAGPRGGCHHAGGHTAIQECFSGRYDRFAESGKAELVRYTRNRRVAIDSAIVCTFASFAFSDQTIAALLQAATGDEWTVESLLELGDKASDLERAFNVREGVTRAADVLPARFLEESVPAGSTKGSRVQDLDLMLDEMYQACGWCKKTGIPTREKLEQDGFGWIADDLWRDR
ncbi:MAG: aldehyde ferredoxin oxidoreductase C-terminal domain-containing protein, partial [Bacillota bacterium]